MEIIKMITVIGEYSNIEAREAADYINRIASANGWTAEDREKFEEQISECDTFIANKLTLEEYEYEIEE